MPSIFPVRVPGDKCARSRNCLLSSDLLCSISFANYLSGDDMRKAAGVLLNCLVSVALLSGCAAIDAASVPVAGQQKASLAAPEHVMLPADGRTIDLSIYRPVSAPLGAIFLSHGAGGSPARLELPIDRLRDAGFVVLAPLHGDALLIPEDRREDLRTALMTRIGDLQAVSAYSAQAFPDLPYGAVGHSYGSLIGLIGGGALQMFDARVPRIEAVASFSSPGIIPGLTEPEGRLETVAVPTLMITGTADTVEPFALDPQSHATYFERQPAGDRTLLVINGASHDFVYGEEAHYDEAMDLLVTFLRAELLDDAAAATSLASAQTGSGITIRR